MDVERNRSFLGEHPRDADDSRGLAGESGEGARREVERSGRDARRAHVRDGRVHGCSRVGPDLDLTSAVLATVVLTDRGVSGCRRRGGKGAGCTMRWSMATMRAESELTFPQAPATPFSVSSASDGDRGVERRDGTNGRRKYRFQSIATTTTTTTTTTQRASPWRQEECRAACRQEWVRRTRARARRRARRRLGEKSDRALGTMEKMGYSRAT
jgi:hypothetical protein